MNITDEQNLDKQITVEIIIETNRDGTKKAIEKHLKENIRTYFLLPGERIISVKTS